MGSIVYIEISGKIESAETISALVDAAAAEGGTAWGSAPNVDEAAEQIFSAADSGQIFALMSDDMRSLFEKMTAVCQAHGLSYVIQSGEFGDEGHELMKAWMPGMDKPYEGDRIKPQSDLWKALDKDTARSLVRDLESRTLQYAKDRRIEVTPEAREAFAAASPRM